MLSKLSNKGIRNEKHDEAMNWEAFKPLLEKLVPNIACQKCRQIVDEILTLSNCCHRFCPSCLDDGGDICPLCGVIYTSSVLDPHLMPIIENFKEINLLVKVDVKSVLNKFKDKDKEDNFDDQVKKVTPEIQTSVVNDKISKQEVENIVIKSKSNIKRVREKANPPTEVSSDTTEKNMSPQKSPLKSPIRVSKRQKISKKGDFITQTSPVKLASSMKAQTGNKKRTRKESKDDVDEECDTFKVPAAKKNDNVKNKKVKTTDTEYNATCSISKTRLRSSSFSKFIIMMTGLDDEQHKVVDQFGSKFGVKVIKDFDENATHLVCKADQNLLAPRTVKYMQALLSNMWLLSYEWVLDCLKKDELLDPESYELQGTSKQDESFHGMPRFSRTTKIKLFEGLSFYLDGKFASKGALNKSDLAGLIKLGKGTIVDNRYRLSSSIKKGEKIIIISDFKSDSYGNVMYTTTEIITIITNFEQIKI